MTGFKEVIFFCLKSTSGHLCIQLKRNVAELKSSSKSHWSQDGISLDSEAPAKRLPPYVKPTDALKGGAECQKNKQGTACMWAASLTTKTPNSGLSKHLFLILAHLS